MIPGDVVETINDIRFVFQSVAETLPRVPSFRSLLQTSPPLDAVMKEVARVAESPRVREPCDGRVTCAIIGSSGHGKTTIVDEMFPRLSERGWLVTDVTDTTSQSLRIGYAPEGSEELGAVTVNSWSGEQIKELMSRPEVDQQNRRDDIRVSYLEDGVEVDGSEASFADEDVAGFVFPRRLELRPFPAPYAVPPERARDRAFIRALTVKEQSGKIARGTVLEAGSRAYDALQLRAVVKDVSLRDSYERIAEWGRLGPEDLARLGFVDTPGLAVSGSVKDEVLRHFLERKSDQIALQLWKDDELDVVVHLVLCGRQSDFAGLWKAIERECGPAEMEGLAERLIVAVNGMNLYFTNRDVKKKYEDPEAARREGDHFATTLEDNILQKMSPRGRVRPARIVFLDSRSIVETVTGRAYGEAYASYRPVMERWLEPGGVGHETLSALGLLESFRANVEALCDPEDCGQGFLVRQLVDVVRERGPALLVRKHLVRTGLLRAVEELHDQLRLYYDAEGNMNREAVREALKSCLAFLDPGDLQTLEDFAAAELDSRIEELVPRGRRAPVADGWVPRAFAETCTLVREAVAGRSRVAPELEAEFNRHFDGLASVWAERWGYAEARLAPPDKGYANSADLLAHCLKIHAREMLYQLLVADGPDGDAGTFEQAGEDRRQVRNVLGMLDEARRMGAAACAEHGVTA